MGQHRTLAQRYDAVDLSATPADHARQVNNAETCQPGCNPTKAAPS